MSSLLPLMESSVHLNVSPVLLCPFYSVCLLLSVCYYIAAANSVAANATIVAMLAPILPSCFSLPKKIQSLLTLPALNLL